MLRIFPGPTTPTFGVTVVTGYVWTQEDFGAMSWHDNHVHALRIKEGEHGTGDLTLDIDYILEWIKQSDGFRFRILPSTLTFHGVFNLQVRLDYASVTAGIMPFSIHEIRREEHDWVISINWPAGEIRFQATGFTQSGRGSPVMSSGQWLSVGERV